MSPLILLGIICFFFGLLPIILRSNILAMFLTLFAGEAVSMYLSQDITDIIGSFVNVNFPLYNFVQVGLLVISPIILLILTKKSFSAIGFVGQIIPMLALIASAMLLIAPKLPYEQQHVIESSKYYLLVKPYAGVLIATALVCCIIYFSITKSKQLPKKKH